MQDSKFLSGKFSIKNCVYELFIQKRVDIAITKSVITHFRLFYHSQMCCPAFNSLKEWKFTRLHLESSSTWDYYSNTRWCFLVGLRVAIWYDTLVVQQVIKNVNQKILPLVVLFMVLSHLVLSSTVSFNPSLVVPFLISVNDLCLPQSNDMICDLLWWNREQLTCDIQLILRLITGQQCMVLLVSVNHLHH